MQGSMLLEPRRFESVNVTTIAERILIGFGGLVCFAPVWELFFRYRLDPFQLGYLPFWIIALIGGSMSVCLLAGAILGGTQTIVLDATARTLEVRHRYWRRSRNRHWRFDELGALDVTEDSWSDGPASYRLTIAPKHGKPIELRDFSARADAEAVKAALERMMT